MSLQELASQVSQCIASSFVDQETAEALGEVFSGSSVFTVTLPTWPGVVLTTTSLLSPGYIVLRLAKARALYRVLPPTRHGCECVDIPDESLAVFHGVLGIKDQVTSAVTKSYSLGLSPGPEIRAPPPGGPANISSPFAQAEAQGTGVRTSGDFRALPDDHVGVLTLLLPTEASDSPSSRWMQFFELLGPPLLDARTKLRDEIGPFIQPHLWRQLEGRASTSSGSRQLHSDTSALRELEGIQEDEEDTLIVDPRTLETQWSSGLCRDPEDESGDPGGASGSGVSAGPSAIEEPAEPEDEGPRMDKFPFEALWSPWKLRFHDMALERRFVLYQARMQRKIDRLYNGIFFVLFTSMCLMPPYQMGLRHPFIAMFGSLHLLPVILMYTNLERYDRIREPVMASMLLLAAGLTCILATPNTLDTVDPRQLRSLQNLLRLIAVEVLSMSAIGDLVRLRVFLLVDAVCCAMQLRNFPRMCVEIFPELPFLSTSGLGSLARSCGLRLSSMLVVGAYLVPAGILYVLEMRSRRAYLATLSAAQSRPAAAAS